MAKSKRLVELKSDKYTLKEPLQGINVVDTTGAGDTFNGVLAVCIAENMESDEDYTKQYTQPMEYSVLREDTIRPSFDHGEILSCADDSIDGFIRLRKKA